MPQLEHIDSIEKRLWTTAECFKPKRIAGKRPTKTYFDVGERIKPNTV